MLIPEIIHKKELRSISGGRNVIEDINSILRTTANIISCIFVTKHKHSRSKLHERKSCESLVQRHLSLFISKTGFILIIFV